MNLTIVCNLDAPSLSLQKTLNRRSVRAIMRPGKVVFVFEGCFMCIITKPPDSETHSDMSVCSKLSSDSNGLSACHIC
jgi:hypothetical protein